MDEGNGDLIRFHSPKDGGEVHLKSWTIKNIDIDTLNGNNLFTHLDPDSITEINGHWSIRNDQGVGNSRRVTS